jgi:uncharacterized protein
MTLTHATSDEELAGPVIELNPTDRAERVSGIDVLRGFALLGILVMNIDSFGNTEGAHDIPIGTAIDSFSGPHAHWNMLLLIFKWVFFEGKMRGIFSMLFGAGVILMTSRAERRGAAASVADAYMRRNMLLVAFGILHGTFIWSGDILFDYGMAALLFLYPARKLSARTLLLTGIILSLIVATYGAFSLLGATQDFTLSREAKAIAQLRRDQQPISAEQLAVEKKWQARVNSHVITADTVRQSVGAGRAGYWEQVERNLTGYFGPGITIHIDLMFDVISAMLIGMGLFKTGFLTARSSDATYVYTALVGFAVSIPLYVYGILHSYQEHFDFVTLDRWVWLPYYATRDAGMLAIAALVLLMVKHGVLRAPQRWLAAVGKTAFSNYIGTSIVCQFIFLWGPWKLFGTMEYFQLMYVVMGVWALNLVFSTQWLRFFEYGPLEWLWRSLTYWKAQPMRRLVPC